MREIADVMSKYKWNIFRIYILAANIRWNHFIGARIYLRSGKLDILIDVMIIMICVKPTKGNLCRGPTLPIVNNEVDILYYIV